MGDPLTGLGRWPVLRFAGVGAANTGVHYATYLCLLVIMPYPLAHGLAGLVATCGSYFLNCRFTFHIRPTMAGFVVYPLSTLVNLTASTALVLLGVEVFGVDSRYAGLAAGIAVFPVTFVTTRQVLTRRFAFVLSEQRRRELRCGGGVAVLTALLAHIPLLVNKSFYFSDDSAAQFVPMWYRLGESLRAGHWPQTLDTNAWMGGNLAAESLFGIWNPVNMLDCVVVSMVGDLAVAAAIVKIQYLVLLAVGVFALCRGYRANTPAASALAVAFPVSGFVLYYDAASWAGSLAGLAWLPWAWHFVRRWSNRQQPVSQQPRSHRKVPQRSSLRWSIRTAAREHSAALIAFSFCFLCVSSGDPYGVLGLCVVFLGLVAESWLSVERRRSRVLRVVVLGIASALVVPLIFGPLLASASVTWRSSGELLNSGQLTPGIGDLLALSTPSYLAHIQSFGADHMTVPALYMCWFALPLLPWFDWQRVVGLWRHVVAPVVVAACYALLCLGPSNVWMFRWPVRHTTVLFLALSVLLAGLMSSGLRVDHGRIRLMWTCGALLVPGYLACAAWPDSLTSHVLFEVLVCVLTGVVLLLARRRVRLSRIAMVLHAGTVCVLCVQLAWFPVNSDVAMYHFPTEVRRIRADFARWKGQTVFQVADRDLVSPVDIRSEQAWRHLLFGNMYAVASVPSLVSYTGIGHRALHERLCLSYYGSTCAGSLERLWQRDETAASLADQLKLDHVVVQRSLVDRPAVPRGWRITERNRFTTVVSRNAPWDRAATLSVATGRPVRADIRQSDKETVVLEGKSTTPVRLVFARIAWPGYQAIVDGRSVPARATSAGLLTITLPAGVSAHTVTVTWVPPGLRIGIVLALLGMFIALAAPALAYAGKRSR